MNGKPRAGTGARLGDASNTCIPGNGKKERVRSCLRTNDDIGHIVSFDLTLDGVVALTDCDQSAVGQTQLIVANHGGLMVGRIQQQVVDLHSLTR